MPDEIYERLIDALDALPNGFPRTTSRVEIRLLRKIFSEDEATLAGNLTRKWETVDQIAERLSLPHEDTSKRLFQLARRGIVWIDRKQSKTTFRLAPFIVGSFEAQLELMDHEMAHLVEQYFIEGGSAGIMQPQPALHRVIPHQNTLKTEWIMPYEDVRALLLNAKSFHVQSCICRVQQDHMGRRCDFPVDMCMSFSDHERAAWPGDISQPEALALLDKSEELGLVHTVSNVIEGVNYICNCCGCCCGILRGITDFGIAKSVAYANYYAVIDPVICNGCGTCIERCQVGAISEGEGVSVVDRERCIGCGLCVSGCPNDVARLERKPEAEIVVPPVNFSVWEEERLRYRHG